MPGFTLPRVFSADTLIPDFSRFLTRPRVHVVLALIAGACVLLTDAQALDNPSRVSAPSKQDAGYPGIIPSCAVDFTSTLDAPAGGHGYLSVGRDGHFHWGDGKRARFWGVNISSSRLNVPNEQIEKVAATLASAGVNLVRLEAIDNRNCLLGGADTQTSFEFDAKYLDRLDKWTDTLRRHGIYYYLDLLDFRTFKPGDKVTNAEAMERAARPYAMFDEYLIQLQQEFAEKLLNHRNPYSNLRPVDDQALAMVELCNEHGFFLYPDRLEKLAEPYEGDLRQRWNHWLHDHYGTTQNVSNAWATAAVPVPLRPDEQIEQNTIELPTFSIPPDATARVNMIPRRLPGRLHDGVRFLADLQRRYCKTMRTYLRDQVGLKVPVTAVVSGNIVPDIASVASECDFTAENWYGETDGLDPNHPSVRFVSGKNPLRNESPHGFAPATASLRWFNKPVVIREWGASWPNKNRAASVPEVAAYGALQDCDALILFGYQTNTDTDGSAPDRLNDLAFQCDPTVWGMYAICGQAFLRGAIHPAQASVTLTYSDARLNTWPNLSGEGYKLAWSVRVNSIVADAPTGPYSFVPSGSKADLGPMRDILDDLSREGVELNPGFDKGIWRSDTSELTLYAKDGRLEIDSPTFCAIAGELVPGHTYDLGVFKLSTPSPLAAFAALSLDGKALTYSKHILVKMVTRAENTGEIIEKAPPGSPETYVLRKHGTSPILTFGRPSAAPLKLWYAPGLPEGDSDMAPYLTLGLVDGIWELEIKDGHGRLICDTPGVTGSLASDAIDTRAVGKRD